MRTHALPGTADLHLSLHLASALNDTCMTCDTAYCMKETHSAQTTGSFAAQTKQTWAAIFTSSGGYASFSHRWQSVASVLVLFGSAGPHDYILT